jgi:hypothetical protein
MYPNTIIENSIQMIRVRLRYKEIKKSKTVNFYCIVDCAHWGHHVKKNAPYCSTSVVVWKRIKSTKINKEILDFYTL